MAEVAKTIVPGTPTQVAHPGQAIKRTLSTLIAGLTVVLGILALVSEVFGVYLGDNIIAWVAGASAFLAAVVVFLTRLQALESLQEFWTKLGLGTGVEKEDTPVVDSGTPEPVSSLEEPAGPDYLMDVEPEDGTGRHRGDLV